MKIQTSTKEKSIAFERVHIPEDIYMAELKEVKEISEGTYGKRLAFIYNIVDKNVDVALVVYNRTATKDNKLGQTIMAHGSELNDKEVDLDNLPQKKVRAWVDDYEYEEEVDGKKVKKTASTISKVKPLAEKVE